MKEKIALVYRTQKRSRFSIETVFRPLEKTGLVNKYCLPCDLNSVVSFFRVLVFALRLKEKTVHITGDIHFLVLFLFRKNVILTVHDSNYYESLMGVKKWIYALFWFKLPLRFADVVVVISPYVKNQISENFNIDIQKIVVIPNFLPDPEHTGEPIIRTKNEKFRILCIGNAENKNIRRLIDALEPTDNIEIRIIGLQANIVISLLKSKGLNYSLCSNLSRLELTKEYLQANLLFFASTKEGFGLPILEAQFLGVPVLTSTTTSMPYVAGDGAILVDPYSVHEIRSAILAVIQGERNLDELKNRGLENVLRFKVSSFIDRYSHLYSNYLSYSQNK